MQRIFAFLICSLFPIVVSAQSLSFSPPNPDSAAVVTLRAGGVWSDSCVPRNPQVSIAGRSIDVTVSTPLGVGCLLVISTWEETARLGPLSPGVYRVRVIIGGPSNALTLIERDLIVSESDPPFTLTPNVGSGGSLELVRLRGINIASCKDTPICLPPVVRFDNAIARVDQIFSPNEIVVQPPSRQPGPVDVTVQMGNDTYRNVAGFYYMSFAERNDPAFFEPVLFPVVFAGPGAFGSRWDTQVSLRNENDYPFTSPNSIFDVFCFPICDSHPPARSSRIISGQTFANGHVLSVPRQAAPQVHFGVLVKDLSRQSETLGTEIPVVREDHLYDRAFQLLNVPADANYRVTLRLYDVESPRRLRVGIGKMDSVNPALNIFVELTGNSPAYFIINDLIGQYPTLAGQGPLRIEIDTLTQETIQKTFWGFASVTNNTTQHVTVISPQ